MRGATLHRARKADLSILLPLIAEFCAVDAHPYDEARVCRALGPLLENDSLGVVWLIGEPPGGYAVLTWNYSLESGGRDALLDEIYLRERGRGFGAAALAAIHGDLRRRGITRVFLETETHNERARRFYARNGYEVEPSTWMAAELETPR
ncbi:GNAT family N-acetyltransferase [Pseudohaliea rubra]|uniref:Acetyltransferase, GNAT family n=1 Tax=Pseudohaliea rubra DSM 19751 TaxID=1265313 RepID=A0A095X218_9GAMM|nr:GNAT family N-acetyltransferase [Pseudohaliea rubra]KGE04929.1 Acetyltransferase, GNAT family [Pseudohaliea rubra DSM 19751]